MVSLRVWVWVLVFRFDEFGFLYIVGEFELAFEFGRLDVTGFSFVA